MTGMQISGIMSNLNTAEMVEALLTIDNQNVTLLQYDQTVKTNQISTYQALNAKLLAFQTQANLLTRSSSFTAASVTSSDESYVTAIAGDNVGLGTYTINVDALAQNHQIASQGFSEDEIANLGTGTVVLSVGSASAATLVIDSSNNSLEGLKQAINDARMGVRASIINDGSSSNPYRLLLTSDKTGAANEINIDVSLDGAKVPDFTSASFDDVELTGFSADATSAVTLGTNASYTGGQNKTYTFTVAGNGMQTVGSGDIILDWTDGTNSGSIVVSSADVEVELSGAGADGLRLQFGAGTLVAGDSFQVQSFAPLLQQAQDARVSMGSTSGGASPITVTSATNLVSGLISGVTLHLQKVTDGMPVIINAQQDTSQVEDSINGYIDKFNDVMAAIEEQFRYDPELEEDAGLLFGDRTLMMIQTSMQSRVTSLVEGLGSEYRMLADIGIRLGASGKLAVVDRSRLQEALTDNAEEVRKLFATSGESSHAKISFLAASEDTVVDTDGYEVKITQVARHGYLRGAVIADPSDAALVVGSTNKNLKLKIDGIASEDIVLTEGSYVSSAELVEELQSKINADQKIGSLGVSVEWIETAEGGYLRLTSGTYGSNSKIEMSGGISDDAYTVLGLSAGQSVTGQDVAGTIGGEEATGSGQILSGKSDNKNTAGLKIRVEFTDADMEISTTATITILKGIAAKSRDFADSLTKSVDGTIARRTKALQGQVEDIEEQVARLEERIELKRQRLLQQFLEMETILGQLESESSYLETQLANLSSNWNFGSNSSSGN